MRRARPLSSPARPAGSGSALRARSPPRVRIDAERLRRSRRDRAAARRAGRAASACAAAYVAARHGEAGRDPRADRRGGARPRRRSTSWSTMPASSTSRRSSISRTSAGTRSSRSTCRPRFTPRRRPCRDDARRWGRIINIASAHGLVASGEKAAYVTAKHGLVGLTKVTAIETANQGITCNAICPGWVLTPLVQQQIEARARQRDPGRTGARGPGAREAADARFTTPEKIGALAVFLCGETPSTITGAALSIDGGWTAQ